MSTTEQTRVSWDHWRANYDQWTTADQNAFYDQVWDEYPDQRRAKTQPVLDLLEYIGRDVQVVEFGGWDGGLAKDVLELDVRQRVDLWVNYEICRRAIEATVCDDHRYVAWSKPGFYWQYDHECDLFISCHSIEHLRVSDVRRVLAVTDSDYLHIQTPLDALPRDWTGYPGTHIIEVGWDGLQQVIEGFGYTLIPSVSGDHARSFERTRR